MIQLWPKRIKIISTLTIVHYLIIAKKTEQTLTHQFTYLNIPLMSTSLTSASTMGKFTTGFPIPTTTKVPPDLVAWKSNQSNKKCAYKR